MLRRVILTRDLTNQQRIERRQQVQIQRDKRKRTQETHGARSSTSSDPTLAHRDRSPIAMDTLAPQLSPIERGANLSHLNFLQVTLRSPTLSQPYDQSTLLTDPTVGEEINETLNETVRENNDPSLFNR